MSELRAGDRVRLLRIDESFYRDSPNINLVQLRRWIGTEARFSGYTGHGLMEVEFKHEVEGDGRRITVVVDPSWIERVS
jgi:hypothetical protein